jgi:hypothetical protein
MLASRIVCLALGIGLGLIFGIWLRDEPEAGRSPPPRIVPEVVTVREPASPQPAPRPERETVAVAVTPIPSAAPPGSPLPEEEREDMTPGVGRLVVDFTEADWAEPRFHVDGRLLEGGRVRFKVEADDDGIAEVELLAGTHTISWVEGPKAMGQRVLNVEIREGWVTRVDVTDPDLPRLDPVGDGLGRLEISVADLGGGPLPDTEVEVWGREFHGGEQKLSRATNAAGRVRFDVLPGRYLVDVGLRSEAVVVRAGDRTLLDVHYEQEGELVVEGGLPGAIGIVAFGASGRISSRSWGSGISEHHFAYLRPGDYLITYQNGKRIAGRATVRAGQVTRFNHDPPTGALLLNLVVPESRDRQHISVRVLEKETGFLVGQTSNYVRNGLSVPLQNLAPGTYRVRVTGRTFETHEEEVVVGVGRTDRRIELSRP